MKFIEVESPYCCPYLTFENEHDVLEGESPVHIYGCSICKDDMDCPTPDKEFPKGCPLRYLEVNYASN